MCPLLWNPSNTYFSKGIFNIKWVMTEKYIYTHVYMQIHTHTCLCMCFAHVCLDINVIRNQIRNNTMEYLHVCQNWYPSYARTSTRKGKYLNHGISFFSCFLCRLYLQTCCDIICQLEITTSESWEGKRGEMTQRCQATNYTYMWAQWERMENREETARVSHLI